MEVFDMDLFHGFLIKGALRPALEYLAQFPEQKADLQRYQSIFENAQYLVYPVDDFLNQLLLVFQHYYRNVFYLEHQEEEARQEMQRSFAQLLPHGADPFGEGWEKPVQAAFEAQGFHYLGDKTSGYYGPYIWKTTKQETYQVELPEGTQPYRVNLLSDFLSRSWLDYLSLGRVGTGGWADEDGILNCVASSYDFASEAFTVSFLKHEAQHAMDLARNPALSPVVLEYRAKLVELIYSTERNRLLRFAKEADGSNKANAHSAASEQIVAAFQTKFGVDALSALSIPQIQETARALFAASDIS